MPPSSPAHGRIRRAASLVFGLSVAATTLRLTACFVNVGPTNPHVNEGEDTEPGTADPADVSDPADASDSSDASDAGEEP